MKTKLIVSLIMLGLLTLAFIFKNKPETVVNSSLTTITPGNISSDFLIGAMDDGYDEQLHYVSDSLGLNLWHYYNGYETWWDGKKYPQGWPDLGDMNDHLYSPLANYLGDVQGILHNISQHNMQSFMMRPKVDYLCFGQRSDYKCVDTSLIEDPFLWFYTFQSPNHVGTDIQDTTPYGSGQYVRYCQGSPTSPESVRGMVVSRLRTNNEQCRRYHAVDAWSGDSERPWLIKPRIRIDSTVADNSANWETPVCSITVKNDEGNTFKNVVIRVKNFLDSNNNYDGRYLEEYKPYPSDTAKLTYEGDWGNNWYYSSRGNHLQDYDNDNHADIQVYWYGNCDMWIDQVRVDNDIADELFKHQHDDWLVEEAYLACHSDGALKFYIELAEFNNIPCIAYVGRKLRAVNPNIGLMCDLNFTNYNTMIPFSSWEHIFDGFVGVEHVRRFLIPPVVGVSHQQQMN